MLIQFLKIYTNEEGRTSLLDKIILQCHIDSTNIPLKFVSKKTRNGVFMIDYHVIFSQLHLRVLRFTRILH